MFKIKFYHSPKKFTHACLWRLWKIPGLNIRYGQWKPLLNEIFFLLILVTTLGSAHLRSGKQKPLFNETYFWLLSDIGYYHILGMFRNWLCSDIGYVQTLGMFRHLVRSNIGYVQSLGMLRHWVCSDIGSPYETAGHRVEPSPSQKGDPRTAGPVD